MLRYKPAVLPAPGHANGPPPPDARLMVTPVPLTLEWRNPDALDRLLAPVFDSANVQRMPGDT